MTTPNTKQASPEKIAQLIGIVRFIGAVMVLAGTCIWLNIADIGGRMGLDDTTRQVLAGMFVAMGLTEFFIMPKLLRRGTKTEDKAL